MRLAGCTLLMGIFVLVALPVSAQKNDGCGSQSQCRLEARCADAVRFIEQSERFKAQAHRYRQLVELQEGQATLLLAQAKQLKSDSKSASKDLKGGVKQDAALLKLDAKTYQAQVQQFRNHAQLYNLHLQEYEKQLAAAAAANGQLQSVCQQYADHVYKYHVPGVKPPHICVQLVQSEREMQGYAQRFREDQAKSARVEQQLAQQEAALAAAAGERSAIEKKLLQKAGVAQVEQTQGVLVLAEFQALAREYKNLDSMRKRLGVR